MSSSLSRSLSRSLTSISACSIPAGVEPLVLVEVEAVGAGALLAVVSRGGVAFLG